MKFCLLFNVSKEDKTALLTYDLRWDSFCLIG